MSLTAITPEGFDAAGGREIILNCTFVGDSIYDLPQTILPENRPMPKMKQNRESEVSLTPQDNMTRRAVVTNHTIPKPRV